MAGKNIPMGAAYALAGALVLVVIAAIAVLCYAVFTLIS